MQISNDANILSFVLITFCFLTAQSCSCRRRSHWAILFLWGYIFFVLRPVPKLLGTFHRSTKQHLFAPGFRLRPSRVRKFWRQTYYSCVITLPWGANSQCPSESSVPTIFPLFQLYLCLDSRADTRLALFHRFYETYFIKTSVLEFEKCYDF